MQLVEWRTAESEVSGSILTSRTETNSLSRVVRDGGYPCSVPLSGRKKSSTVETSTWPLNSHNFSIKLHQNKQKFTSFSYFVFNISYFEQLFAYFVQCN